MAVIYFTAVVGLCLTVLFVKDHLPAGRGGT
jgi:hypothetical protein